MFGDVSTGAHNDLARATDIARSMVKEYGMSEQLGQIYFSDEKRSPFLDMGGLRTRGEYSENTADLIDAEIKAIIDQEYEAARKILREKQDVLIKGAQLLLGREKIDGEEIRALLFA
jgi:cell division protease FtsH